MNSKFIALLACLSLPSLVLAEGAAGPAAAGNPMGSFVMIGIMFVAMYFLMIRPQNKKAKEHRDLISNIAKGDEVITQGGMLGKVARDAGHFFVITLSEGVEVPMQKQAISQVLPKGTIKSL